MITYYHTVRTVANRIAGAIDRSVTALRDKRVEHEPAMTDRMLGAIEEAMNGFESKGIQWTAKTLTDRGKKSQESRDGADFMGVLKIDLPEYQVTKGFLAQAKLVRGGDYGNVSELKAQCRKMLKLSSHSFVFLYSEDGVRVVPAIAVLGAQFNPQDIYSRSGQRFFEEHLQCYFGDPRIVAPSPDQLDTLRKRYDARCAFMLVAAPFDLFSGEKG